MDGQKIKRGRGRPRKTTTPAANTNDQVLASNDPMDNPDHEDSVRDSSDLDVVDEQFSADQGDLEAELQRAMDADIDVPVAHIRGSNIDYCDDTIIDDGIGFDGGSAIDKAAAKRDNQRPTKVKKMTTTTRKMLKFGYSQALRMSEPLTQGRVPGEKMCYILQNDEQADAILDEILSELDAKYKVEQYLGPESKLALFTAQLFMQAKSTN